MFSLSKRLLTTSHFSRTCHENVEDIPRTSETPPTESVQTWSQIFSPVVSHATCHHWTGSGLFLTSCLSVCLLCSSSLLSSPSSWPWQVWRGVMMGRSLYERGRGLTEKGQCLSWPMVLLTDLRGEQVEEFPPQQKEMFLEAQPPETQSGMICLCLF